MEALPLLLHADASLHLLRAALVPICAAVYSNAQLASRSQGLTHQLTESVYACVHGGLPGER